MKKLAFLLFLAFSATLSAQHPATKTASALDVLNTSFRNQYALTRAENLATFPLIIIADTPAVTWISHGKTHVIPMPMTHYTETKILLHAILGTYGVGSRIVRSGGTGTHSEWQDARQLVTNIDTALRLTGHTTLAPAEQQRLHKILLYLKGEVTKWIAAGSLTQKQLEQSLRPTRRDALILANGAALKQYQNLRNAFFTIQKSVSTSDWKGAFVVIPGPAPARRNNLQAEAAVSVFGRRALGQRIFYSENIFDTPGAVQILAGLQVDRGLSETFFGNPYRMWRDLLGDAAKGKIGGGIYPGLAH
ncbi:MAG: hypothetical protein ABIP97_13115 [Chthoniobacterales bacterium]